MDRLTVVSNVLSLLKEKVDKLEDAYANSSDGEVKSSVGHDGKDSDDILNAVRVSQLDLSTKINDLMTAIVDSRKELSEKIEDISSKIESSNSIKEAVGSAMKDFNREKLERQSSTRDRLAAVKARRGTLTLPLAKTYSFIESDDRKITLEKKDGGGRIALPSTVVILSIDVGKSSTLKISADDPNINLIQTVNQSTGILTLSMQVRTQEMFKLLIQYAGGIDVYECSVNKSDS